MGPEHPPESSGATQEECARLIAFSAANLIHLQPTWAHSVGYADVPQAAGGIALPARTRVAARAPLFRQL